jgi:2'-5' RNA ligase
MNKRLFIAINIPVSEKVRDFAQKIQQHFIDDKIKWVPLVNFHLTIKFLGETDENIIPEITKQIKTCTEKFNPFEISISGIGKFPKTRQPKVIWLGIKDANNIIRKLFTTVNNSMTNLGFDSQNKFSPHITLGRIKFIKNKQLLNNLIDTYSDVLLQQITVSNIILYESILKPSGAEYRIIEKFDL